MVLFNPIRSILLFINNHLAAYPTPVNLNYWWNFGSIAGVLLVLQIASGTFLGAHYCSDASQAFQSVEYILRDVNYGWLFKHGHSVGASFVFVATYIHIAKNIYFRCYCEPKTYLWYSGIIIFLLMMATAFVGYVLPWGQMSFWGATVITNLFSALPLFGEDLAQWLWGGFSVSVPTLRRFYVLHFVLAYLALGFMVLHLLLLHDVGSSSPMGSLDSDKSSFYAYYILKDLFGLSGFFLIFEIVVFWYPNTLGHPDNYIPANIVSTPTHIVPEWYFLPFYAILRAIPDKSGGILCMGFSILILFFVPILDNYPLPQSGRFRHFFKYRFWLFISCVCLLGWLGSMPAAAPYLLVSQLLTVGYFSFFFNLYFMRYLYPSNSLNA